MRFTRALVKQPQLLLLDEPLSNLDATLRLTMRTEIKSLQKKLGVTTILVTHDQIEATTMADRIICMRAGRIEQIGTPDDLYRKPESLFPAGFIGSPLINLIRGEARGPRSREVGPEAEVPDRVASFVTSGRTACGRRGYIDPLQHAGATDGLRRSPSIGIRCEKTHRIRCGPTKNPIIPWDRAVGSVNRRPW
jgi:ABC-type sugar transport system ATPase subunit